MRFSFSTRAGEAKASDTSAKVSAKGSAKQASRGLNVIFMMIFVPEEPSSSAMLRFGAERDLNETRRTERESKAAKSLSQRIWASIWPRRTSQHKLPAILNCVESWDSHRA